MNNTRMRILRGIAAAMACCVTGFLVTPSSPAQESLLAKGIPEGTRLIEGDILVRLPPSGSLQAQGVYMYIFCNSYWPNGVVPYEFDGNVIKYWWTNSALDAMAEWERVAHVVFRQRSSEENYIHIQNSTANNSFVGCEGGGQVVNIHDWNDFIIVHELGHALGFHHEMTRSDRDTYVTINWDNISEPDKHNFEMHKEAKHYGPYDFDSIMHYAPYDFAIDTNVMTITVLPPYDVKWQNAIGQRNHLSYWDQHIMSYIYPDPDLHWVFVDWSAEICDALGTFENGTFIHPFTSFTKGLDTVPAGGTLFLLRPYVNGVAWRGVHSKSMTLRAPLGAILR